jgi:RND superfamily putative drug exporter
MRVVARAIVRYRILVLVVSLAALAAAAVLGAGVADVLSNGGFSDPDSESVAAASALAEDFGAAPADAVLVVQAPRTVDDPAVAAAGVALVEELGAEAGVASVTSYWTLGSPPGLRSDDSRQALVFVDIAGGGEVVLDVSAGLIEEYRGGRGELEVLVGGNGPMFAEIQETTESDLARAEAIAFPITLLLLVFVFGSVVAAVLPLGVGGFAIVGTFLVLRVLAEYTEVSIFALNLTTALGLGLAIDYALFVVSRLREELGTGWSPHEAAARTVQTAGRTVLFSAGTVAVSLAAMLVFPLSFLRSFGYAGIAVVALAAVGAVVVLPALLAILGHRIDRLRVRRVRPVADGEGIWHRIATTVMRRPVPIATAVVVLLLVVGAPFFRVELGQSDDRVLAPGSPARQVGDTLREDFNAFEGGSIDVVVADSSADPAGAGSLAETLSALGGVARVDGPNGSYVAGALMAPAGPANLRFASPEGFYLAVVPSVDPLSSEAEGLVDSIRAVDSPYSLMVAGQTADLVDTTEALFSTLPLALAIIGVVTFVVLFLMFGSLVVPAKAVILNLLSLSATFGALVWIFQDGNLSELLDFTATGTLNLTMPILMFCIAFGLSMDYEVFLLSRIKEEYDVTGDNQRSVAMGLERTGRIVTAAAVLIAVVFVAFATSGVAFLKMFGVGMTLAVLVDAFLIRSTLVPAFMRLAGNANWWAPRWMKRVYRRFGFAESVELDGPNLEVEPSRA